MCIVVFLRVFKLDKPYWVLNLQLNIYICIFITFPLLHTFLINFPASSQPWNPSGTSVSSWQSSKPSCKPHSASVGATTTMNRTSHNFSLPAWSSTCCPISTTTKSTTTATSPGATLPMRNWDTRVRPMCNWDTRIWGMLNWDTRVQAMRNWDTRTGDRRPGCSRICLPGSSSIRGGTWTVSSCSSMNLWCRRIMCRCFIHLDCRDINLYLGVKLLVNSVVCVINGLGLPMIICL